MNIPVSCVEQGRWGYRGRQFHPGDASLYAALRARKAAHVSQSVRAGRGHRADQGQGVGAPRRSGLADAGAVLATAAQG